MGGSCRVSSRSASSGYAKPYRMRRSAKLVGLDLAKLVGYRKRHHLLLLLSTTHHGTHDWTFNLRTFKPHVPDTRILIELVML